MIDTPTLFLVIDAIPLALAQEAWQSGHLPGFSRPRPMISVFPSLTHVAVPALLRGVMPLTPPGYEARYYHPPSGTIRGRLGDRESEAAFAPYRTLISSENRGGGLLGHLAVYLMRQRLAWQEIRWVRWRFRDTEAPWLGYLSATDGVGHFGGLDAMRSAFFDIADQIVLAQQEFAQRHGRPANVVLCSDHGMDFGPLQHLGVPALQRMLKAADLADAVTLAPMGDVSAGAAWCALPQARDVAMAIAEVRGVEVVACRTESGASVFRVSAAGLEEAAIAWEGPPDSSARYRYTPRRGDPLELLERLGAGWISDTAMLAATWDHHYPDPLHRIRVGLTSLVRWPAPVLFSMANGWTYGPSLTHFAAEAMGGQVGTHGALSATQSTGFVATSGVALPDVPAIRAEAVFRPYGEAVRAGLAHREEP